MIKNSKKVTDATSQYKQMPYSMKKRNPIKRIEDHPK